MAIQSPISQYDVNRSTGQATQNVGRQVYLMTYDAIKWVINFIGSMIRMVAGK